MAELTRALTGRLVTLAHVFRVGETATDATGQVAVTVKRLDGTTVASTANANHAGTGTYSFDLAAQANVDMLTVDWSATVPGLGAVVERDWCEIVGGHLFEIWQAREELKLSQTTWTAAKLAAKRIVVEDEAESIAGIALVPRFERVLLDGSGTRELCVPRMQLRTVRSVKVADGPAGPFTALAAAAVAAQPEGVLVWDSIWPAGHRNVLVEYEHGLDFPPAEVSEQAILRLRHVLSTSKTAIPDRAISWTVQEGGVYRLAQAGRTSTGFPDVDAAYRRAGQSAPWIAR